MRTVLSLGLFGTLVATAHRGCGGHEIGRRNHGMLAHRQAISTDEASEAVSIGNTECTNYYYAPVANLKPYYPSPWPYDNVTNTDLSADILPDDATAMDLFGTINAELMAKFPNIQPRGTLDGNFTTAQNYSYLDPDCWWSWRHCTTPAADTGLVADITTVPEPETWGLGFDDGPNCSHNALYDYLQQNDQQATMFYIGSSVFNWPLQALRGTADGHQICVHTWSHRYMTALTNSEAFAELYYGRKIITDVLGVTPTCWRPPYGDVDNRIRFIANKLNLTTIVWSDDTLDWEEDEPSRDVTAADVTLNYQAIIDKVANGTYVTHGPIVLNHELTNYTMTEFISQYPSIKQTFQHVVPLCTALNLTHPYAETDIVCPDFASYIANRSTSAGSTTAASGAGSAPGSTTAVASKTGWASRNVAYSLLSIAVASSFFVAVTCG
ncbi:hypothetical protein BD324DRAFT_684002 [Kockovaella imperatae]|uniref:chitin deacetylase n=1 Tax=Kockovaella imperatae TaxID=4999 RepID=A0A1Y1U8K8_9TREE|nr:hypothetical protein BD324DRAFT_684002 [Kockovaella imperatae]ORX33817.1 hypothetical protein BD324DRAFT_684002 [Kockovaella imperatae]